MKCHLDNRALTLASVKSSRVSQGIPAVLARFYLASLSWLLEEIEYPVLEEQERDPGMSRLGQRCR